MAETFRGPPRPHPTGYTYPQQPRGVDGNHIKFDLKTISAIVVAGAGVVWWGTQQFSDIKYGLREVNTRLSTLSSDVADRMARMEAETKARTVQRYTRADHELFCLRTEAINAAIGWKCAPLHEESKINGRALDRMDFGLQQRYPD